MAILKCKMCGGDLQIQEGVYVAECEFCGTRQTVPNADDDKKIALFGRANKLRASCEFDKAYGVYESLVTEFEKEAEAYWGLVLCKYGIEYVDDPATKNKIPTCHRSSFESVLEDANYKQAIANANVLAKELYESEANKIEEIRKGIIEISSKEEPYDIFICYKESAKDGGRTVDSVIAQDVYKALTGEGYRVFFSRITLEDKLGVKYEPYIFSALHSSKAMLVFGTCIENIEAVWVKNEWSRYLKLIENGEKKTIIPCYRDMDPYDLPAEFVGLQSQDMSKVGAIQDLLHGMSKIIPREKVVERVVVNAQVADPNASVVVPLLKRATIFLQNGDFEKADDYFEKALDFSPENQEALIGKVLVSMKCKSMQELENGIISFLNSPAYKDAEMIFTDETKATFEQASEKIKKNIKGGLNQALEDGDFKTAQRYIDLHKGFDAVSEYILLSQLLVDNKKKSLDELCDSKTVFIDSPVCNALSKVCSSETQGKIVACIEEQRKYFRTGVQESIGAKKFNLANNLLTQLLRIDDMDEQIAIWKFFIECKVSDFDEIPAKGVQYYEFNSYKVLSNYASSITKAHFQNIVKDRVAILEKRIDDLVLTGRTSECVMAIKECLTLDPKNEKALLSRVLIEFGYKSLDQISKKTTKDEVKKLERLCKTCTSYKSLPKEVAKKVDDAIAKAKKRHLTGTLVKVGIVLAIILTLVIGIVSCVNSDSFIFGAKTNSDGETIRIEQYIGSEKHHVVIPSEIDGKPVTTIGGSTAHTFANSDLRSIIIPASVTGKMHGGNFFSCDYLTIYCEAESKPEAWYSSWNNVDNYGGKYAPVIWGIKGHGETDDGFVWVKDSEEKIIIVGYTGDEKIVIIPRTIEECSVYSIAAYAFMGMTGIEKVLIEDNIEYIGKGAFSDNYSLDIYCEAQGSKYNWGSNWKGNANVVYGVDTSFSWEFNEDGETVAITGCSSKDDILTIPSTILGYKVTKIKTHAIPLFYPDTDGISIPTKERIRIIIPINVEIIEKDAIWCNVTGSTGVGITSATIECKHSSKPDGWHENWCPSTADVKWD